ncbi:MAG TPA: peptidylprolyl isomerase [Flavobacteriaceae bacterium]|mgnify:CR=1 FL=1|nr:peptidylprolyl isomerase [Flavobacteriaceae bacterium]MCB9212555.1 peptidylprolyl isomerase [Alteromonas sp.]HPF10623.1 peptidylprolyl isomerase [Flavobacteriaceae bacterium]HQU20905.1 peptidylprolyl isomerase [Flavobacteriaceae bacterium]HQU64389.1 peptidylprolyl isomerase [Flavobacteriaceae bacterium]
MKKILLLSFLALIASTSVFSQKKHDVLLTIDDKPIYAKEFEAIYKKNLDLVQDEEQKSIDGYLKLFIDYKLKVAEGYAQGLDQKETYIGDFSRYEEQLSRNYLFEGKVTSDMVEEAYSRSLEQINASHILITCGWDAFPQDTLAAYNKIKTLRERALKGEDFATLAKNNSEDPGGKQNGGELGYFSVFDMVYPFENAAYNTPVGEISEIVRTQFGYHIIKVNERRKTHPPIVVSHIMIVDRKDSTNFNAEERINEIYGLLKQGESFEELAKKYSDDRNTALNGGRLRPFTKGELKAQSFEDTAFSLQNPGDISEPIKTKFGWHIIRLEEKMDMPPLDEVREKFERKIKDGDRAKVIVSTVNDKIKHKFGFQGYGYLPFFQNFVTDSILKKRWTYEPLSPKENKTLFTIGDKDYHYNDFAAYLAKRQNTIRPYRDKITVIKMLYDEYETMSLKNFYRENLEKENPEYASIINEYRDGLLIFEVMEKNVWGKAKEDTLAQQRYFENHRQDYQWKERIKGAIYRTSNKDDLNQVMDLLKENKTGDEIKKLLNTENVKVLVTSGTFQTGANELPAGYQLKVGQSKIFEENGSFTIVEGTELLPPGPMEFEEVKGRVLTDYQNLLEKEWMEQLRNKYTVEVNQKTLKKIKKELGS